MRTINEQAGQSILNLCGSGSFHVSYGLITIHLTREGFLLPAGQVAQAAGVLKGAALDPELQARPASSACY